MSGNKTNVKTEDLYDMLTSAHFQLLRAYDAVPKWLNDEQQVSPDELESLRKITTENSLLANDLEDDIDALLDDARPDPVESALVCVRDALEMLCSEMLDDAAGALSSTAKNSFIDRARALDDTLDIVDGIIAKHGFVVPQRIVQVQAQLRSAFGGGTASATPQREARAAVVGVCGDGRQELATPAHRVEQAHDAAHDVAGREAPRTGDEPSTTREPTLEEAKMTCIVCGGPVYLLHDSSTCNQCDHCFMMSL